MAKTIENLFRILHYSADLLVIVIFLTYFISRKVKSKELGFIALYSITDFTLNILSNYFSPTEGLYIWSTFTFFEYSIFTFIIWTNIKKTFFPSHDSCC